MPQVISLYIHIPFCAKRCRYCDFYKVIGQEEKTDDFIAALIMEWQLAKKHWQLEEAKIGTIFFGGGTPSLLSLEQWQKITYELLKKLPTTENCEWSIECNPESYTPEKGAFWKESGVDRLSFGVQSLNTPLLNLLGRAHSRERVLELLASPEIQEIPSISVDLMYALPGQNLAIFEQSLEEILNLKIVRHFSAYELTISAWTSFYRHRNKLPLPPEEVVVEMSKILYEECKKHGLQRYEVSNYAMPGHECRHNIAYWRHLPYLGLGPSAHSFIPDTRFSNITNLDKYIKIVQNGELPLREQEVVTKEDLQQEIIFLALRTREGLDENFFSMKTEESFYSGHRRQTLDRFLKEDLIIYEKPNWILSDRGIMVADTIARELF